MVAPRKPPVKAVTFKDAQSAIDGTLDDWLPRLVESNEALEQALLLLRDLHLAGNGMAEDAVLKQVEVALDKAAKAKTLFKDV